MGHSYGVVSDCSKCVSKSTASRKGRFTLVEECNGALHISVLGPPGNVEIEEHGAASL